MRSRGSAAASWARAWPHLLQRPSPGFPPVCRDEQDRRVLVVEGVQCRIAVSGAAGDGPQQRVDDGVAGDHHVAGRHGLGQQVRGRGGRRCQVQRGEGGDEPAVGLLRVRRPDVAGAQASLEVGDRRALVEGGEGGGEGGGGVALHQHDAGAVAAQQRADLGEQVLGHAGQGLAGSQHVQVHVGHDVEQLDDLVEHVPVLGGGNGDEVEPGIVAERRMTGATLMASGLVP